MKGITNTGLAFISVYNLRHVLFISYGTHHKIVVAVISVSKCYRKSCISLKWCLLHMPACLMLNCC